MRRFVAGLDGAAVVRTVLVFWLVWWGWTQFTWALNAADTTHHRVQLATLVATAIAFFMAVAVPDAFAGGALLGVGKVTFVDRVFAGEVSGQLLLHHVDALVVGLLAHVLVAAPTDQAGIRS